MASVMKNLYKKNLISPPPFASETIMEVQIGSVAYGVSSDVSDIDIYGICVPPTSIIFPNSAGFIHGFDDIPSFDQFQKHHIKDPNNDKTYDVTVFNIVKFFDLAAVGNPNIIDTLFVPRRCILYMTKVGEIIRDNRKLFLSKKVWHTFKGYAYAQLKKFHNRSTNPNRQEDIAKNGLDTKKLYHIARLMDEVEQILETGDVNLERAREYLKAIRRGDIPYEEIVNNFYKKEMELETLYQNSKLPYAVNREDIKRVLLQAIEEQHGDMSSYIQKNTDNASTLLGNIKEMLQNGGY